jgi:peptidoglycan/LPS O-acetylase OafA/YrhL
MVFVSNWMDTAYTFNGPVWSVSVEILVYLIFFALLARGATSRPWQRGLMLAVAASVSMVGERAAAAGVPEWLCFENLWQCLAYFYLGGLILDCERAAMATRLAPSRLHQHGAAARGFALLAVGMLVVLAGAAIARCGINLLSVFVIVAGANFAYELAGSRRLARLAKLGILTYSIYLIHFPVQLLIAICLAALGIGTAVMYSPLAFLASTGATILLAWCSYHAFEAPAQRCIRGAWERWEAGKAVKTGAAAKGGGVMELIGPASAAPASPGKRLCLPRRRGQAYSPP